MSGEIKRLSVLRITEDGREKAEETVTREFSLTIELDDKVMVTLLCTPRELDCLAVGFLLSEGLIREKGEIKDISVDEGGGTARVKTRGAKRVELPAERLIASSGGRGAAFHRAGDTGQAEITSEMEISAEGVLTLMRDFQGRSQIFKATGGVHSAALCDTNSILLFTEDIGRHNAIDKIFGKCLLEDVPLQGRGLITSGRVSSEILHKVSREGIPILISKSAPTDVAVSLANEIGITLIGFVRGSKMNVYTHSRRVV